MTGIEQARCVGRRQYIIRELDLTLEIQEATIVLKSEDRPGVTLGRAGGEGGGLQAKVEPRPGPWTAGGRCRGGGEPGPCRPLGPL